MKVLLDSQVVLTGLCDIYESLKRRHVLYYHK